MSHQATEATIAQPCMINDDLEKQPHNQKQADGEQIAAAHSVENFGHSMSFHYRIDFERNLN
jgi:hypothetical protein